MNKDNNKPEIGGISSGAILIILGIVLRHFDVFGSEIKTISIMFGSSFILFGFASLSSDVEQKGLAQILAVIGLIVFAVSFYLVYKAVG